VFNVILLAVDASTGAEANPTASVFREHSQQS